MYTVWYLHFSSPNNTDKTNWNNSAIEESEWTNLKIYPERSLRFASGYQTGTKCDLETCGDLTWNTVNSTFQKWSVQKLKLNWKFWTANFWNGNIYRKYCEHLATRMWNWISISDSDLASAVKTKGQNNCVA